MKRFLCLLLVICMLPISAIFLTSCKKDSDISTFYSSFESIADENKYLKRVPMLSSYSFNNGWVKINFDYSKSPELSSLVDNPSTKYYQIKHFYQAELDNCLYAVCSFGIPISKSKEISQKECNALFDKLNDLKQEYSSMDYYFNILASSLKSTTNESINQTYLKKLFDQYERTIEKASILSALVSQLYFNKVLTNSNPNFTRNSYENLTDSDLVTIIDYVRKRQYYYVSIYADIYNELYINGCDLGDKIINGLDTNSLIYTPYNYISGKTGFLPSSTDELEKARSNKKIIYENAVSLYHIQNQFEKDYKYFKQIKEEVVYTKVNSTSSVYEKNCKALIDQFAYGIAFDSYQVLKNLIDTLFD